jgi:hypothetical protein
LVEAEAQVTLQHLAGAGVVFDITTALQLLPAIHTLWWWGWQALKAFLAEIHLLILLRLSLMVVAIALIAVLAALAAQVQQLAGLLAVVMVEGVALAAAGGVAAAEQRGILGTAAEAEIVEPQTKRAALAAGRRAGQGLAHTMAAALVYLAKVQVARQLLLAVKVDKEAQGEVMVQLTLQWVFMAAAGLRGELAEKGAFALFGALDEHFPQQILVTYNEFIY